MLVVASLAAAVEPARACSCIPPDPWSYLEKTDGAFVGRLVSRREIDQGRAVLTFSVERAVKGKIGTTVEVTTANNGGACGIETSVGRRIGLFLMREGDGWVGHLCWQVEPEDLLAATSLPAPNGKGPVAMFVGGRFGPARTLALDARGRTLAYGMGAGRVSDFSVCPGGSRVAEIVERDSGYVVAIRELPTLRLVRQQRLKTFWGRLRCESATGERLVAFRGSGPDLERRAQLVRISSRTATTIWRGWAWYASIRGHSAYVQVLAAGTAVVTVDLRTGAAKKLGTVPVYGAYQLVLNPAGTRLAGVAYEEGCRVACAHLVVIDLGRRPISARTILLPTECCGYARWLRNDRFAYFSGGPIRVYSAALRLLARVSGWNAVSSATVGSTVFGVHPSDGSLLAVKLPSGAARVVRRLPGWPEVLVSATG